MNAKSRIAWIQGQWEGSPETTQAWYLNQARQLAYQKPDLVVLPELVHTPYFPLEEHPRHFDLAIEKDHPFVIAWQDMARELHAVIVFPFFEKRAPGIYQNSAFIIERDGTIAHLYRKSHIPDDPGFYEKYYFMPGDTGFQVTDTSAGKIGVLICWDQWFPEPARIMALKGTQLLIYPTAIGWDNTEPLEMQKRQLDAWCTSMRAHSIANGIFTLAVNRIGQEERLRFWGNSFLCRPDGSLQCRLDHDQAGAFVEEVLWEESDLQRRAWPYFRDRRIDLYDELTQRWITP